MTSGVGNTKDVHSHGEAICTVSLQHLLVIFDRYDWCLLAKQKDLILGIDVCGESCPQVLSTAYSVLNTSFNTSFKKIHIMSQMQKSEYYTP